MGMPCSGAASSSREAGPCKPALAELVRRLRSLPAESEPVAILEVLEAIECVPLTVEDLRETQLGIITQTYKDSDDQRLRAIVKRLRRSWKDMLKKSQT